MLITLTIDDNELLRVVEPEVCTSSRRFRVVCELHDKGIPTMKWLCPFLSWLTDTNEPLGEPLLDELQDYVPRTCSNGAKGRGDWADDAS